MTFDFGSINWIAVPVAAIASFMVGALWYGLIFGKAWIRLHRYTDEEIEAMGKSQGVTFALFFLCDLLAAAVLALFVVNLDVTGAGQGAVLGIVAWLGFAATVTLVHSSAHRKPLQAYLIDSSYHLGSYLVMGVILGVWR